MFVSQKCQYALRAVFELARRNDGLPVKIADIASTQAIPPRFLEVIMSELKQGGFVQSRRGKHGGYLLARLPQNLKIGEIFRFVEGPLGPVGCLTDGTKNKCRLYAGCVFLPMWERVRNAVSSVYDNTTFQDLLDQQAEKTKEDALCYSI